MKRLLRLLAFVGVFLILYVVADVVRGMTNLRGSSPPVIVYFLIPLVAFPFLFLFFLRQNLRDVAKFEVRPLVGEVSPAFRARVTEVESLGFAPLGPPVTTMFGRVQTSVQPLLAADRSSYAAVYVFGTQPELIVDFDSKLEDGRFVMTNSSPMAARGPVRADVLVQAFSNASPADLLKRHHEALASLGSRAVTLSSSPEDYWDLGRECARRRFEKLTLVEVLQMLRSQHHTTPIASRTRN